MCESNQNFASVLTASNVALIHQRDVTLRRPPRRLALFCTTHITRFE